ncbi:hypothetical protein HY630_02770 [Candidatus Uhrbacteria bacterium]|nr:hypothetical protein [Candidatus Uhrbacteria bacterium]
MTDELQQTTKLVLERGYLASLGIVDEHGPWVADVIYIADEDLNLYWMSTPERRHSRAIDSGHNHVAAAIAVTQSADQPDEGLQISGVAKRVEQPSLELLKQWMRKKRKPLTSAIGAVLTDHVWYQLMPDRIELIYQEKFGYDRQKVL